MEFPVFQFVPVVPSPVTGTMEKSLAPSSWQPSLDVLYALIRSQTNLFLYYRYSFLYSSAQSENKIRFDLLITLSLSPFS